MRMIHAIAVGSDASLSVTNNIEYIGLVLKKPRTIGCKKYINMRYAKLHKYIHYQQRPQDFG